MMRVGRLLQKVSPAFSPTQELQVRMRDRRNFEGYNRDKCRINCPRKMRGPLSEQWDCPTQLYGEFFPGEVLASDPMNR